MWTLLDDPAVFEDDDPIGGSRLRQPVGHHQRRATTGRGLGRRLEFPRTRAACFGGRLVQDRDRRVREDESRQSQLLCLGGGQLVAALPDHGLDAVVQ